jgi:hypothetical protein
LAWDCVQYKKIKINAEKKTPRAYILSRGKYDGIPFYFLVFFMHVYAAEIILSWSVRFMPDSSLLSPLGKAVLGHGECTAQVRKIATAYSKYLFRTFSADFWQLALVQATKASGVQAAH